MPNLWIAALIALFAWWFSTGAILAVVKRADAGGRKSHMWAVLLALPVLVLGGSLFFDTLGRINSGAVYAGFFAALMIWGWIEMAFLCGIITGPNRRETPADVGEAERFVRAWGAVAYHELLLLAALVVMGVASAGAANQVSFQTFAILFAARISAKLNLFYGVPRINTDFLPQSLAHLPTHFRIRRMNRVFPVSILTLTALTIGCLMQIAGAAPHEALGWTFATTIAALALVEHLLMVVPLPDEKLWRWMLPEPRPTANRPVEPAE